MSVTRTRAYVHGSYLCEVCQFRVGELIKKVTETVFCTGTVYLFRIYSALVYLERSSKLEGLLQRK